MLPHHRRTGSPLADRPFALSAEWGDGRSRPLISAETIDVSPSPLLTVLPLFRNTTFHLQLLSNEVLLIMLAASCSTSSSRCGIRQ